MSQLACKTQQIRLLADTLRVAIAQKYRCESSSAICLSGVRRWSNTDHPSLDFVHQPEQQFCIWIQTHASSRYAEYINQRSLTALVVSTSSALVFSCLRDATIRSRLIQAANCHERSVFINWKTLSLRYIYHRSSCNVIFKAWAHVINIGIFIEAQWHSLTYNFIHPLLHASRFLSSLLYFSLTARNFFRSIPSTAEIASELLSKRARSHRTINIEASEGTSYVFLDRARSSIEYRTLCSCQAIDNYDIHQEGESQLMNGSIYIQCSELLKPEFLSWKADCGLWILKK